MDLRNPKVVIAIAINVVLLMLVAGAAFLWTGNAQPPMQPPAVPTLPGEELPLPPQQPQELNREQAVQTITEQECYEMLAWLAHDDREGRMSGKRGNVISAEYIAKEFKEYGLKVKMQRFKIRRMNPGPKNEQGNDYTDNIIGILPGKSKRQIIIGAHMDHIGYGPSMSRSRSRNQIHNGADDNASGTAVIMEIAEAFSKMPTPNHTLVFVAFSGEEMGLIGSRHYVSELSRSERQNIDLMVNFDMVGWLKGQRSITVSGIREIPELVTIVEGLDDDYPFTARAGGSSSGGSDHAPFGNAGIPYAFFHTGGHDHYHTPTDDTERIDFKGLTQIARFAFEMIAQFDEAQLVRRYNVSYPHMNDTIHDHGHPEVRFPTHEDYHEHHQHGGQPHRHSHDH